MLCKDIKDGQINVLENMMLRAYGMLFCMPSSLSRETAGVEYG